jgi:hypothetical protein
MTKLCKKCWMFKHAADFYRNGKYINPWCKDCYRLRNKISHPKRQVVRESNRHNPLIRLHTLFVEAKRRAFERGLEFNITEKSLQEQFARCRCPVTGILFCLDKHSKWRRNPFSPSIDRIDNNKGYVDGNCRLVIWAYNWMKGQMNDEEILEICKAIVRENATRSVRL